MSVLGQPTKREWSFLGTGVAIGIGAMLVYSGGNFYGTVHKNGTTLHSWPGPSTARESLIDKGEDGTPEGWMMTMNPYKDTTIDCGLTDADSDGVFDVCKVEIRPEGEAKDGFMLAVIDTDKNGVFDGVQFSNTGEKGARYSDYKDWDMDGFLDIYTDPARSTSWIMTGTEWLSVIKRVDSEEKRFSVMRNGEEREMVYRGGTWSDVTPVR